MSTDKATAKAMKSLLADLGQEAGLNLQRPAEPEDLMRALCEALGRQIDKTVNLRFKAFPDATGASGLTLEFPDCTLIVVEERTDPEHQLIILGHELWHAKHGHCGHHSGGIAAAARRFSADDVSWDELVAVAARAESEDPDELDAEAFGLRVGNRFRTWMKGPHARRAVTEATVEGRIYSSLAHRSGRLI